MLDDLEMLTRGFREGTIGGRIGYSIGMLLMAFVLFTLIRGGVRLIFGRRNP